MSSKRMMSVLVGVTVAAAGLVISQQAAAEQTSSGPGASVPSSTSTTNEVKSSASPCISVTGNAVTVTVTGTNNTVNVTVTGTNNTVNVTVTGAPTNCPPCPAPATNNLTTVPATSTNTSVPATSTNTSAPATSTNTSCWIPCNFQSGSMAGITWYCFDWGFSDSEKKCIENWAKGVALACAAATLNCKRNEMTALDPEEKKALKKAELVYSCAALGAGVVAYCSQFLPSPRTYCFYTVKGSNQYGPPPPLR